MNQPVPVPRSGRSRALLATAVGAAAAAAITSAVVGTSAANAAPATMAHHPMLTTRHTSLGTVLVNGKGHTLYLFTPDSSKKSVCTGECAEEWPPFTVKSGTKITVGGRAHAAKVTTIKRGRSRQVVYAGHPLYTFDEDSDAGETRGEGIDGTWFALSGAGKALHRGAAGSSSAPSDPDSSDPWG